MTTQFTSPAVRERYELTLTDSAWNAGLRSLLFSEPGKFAVGNVRSVSGHRGERFFVDSLAVRNELPQGDSQPTFAQWSVLHVERANAPFGWNAVELLRRSHPAKSHTVVGLVIRPGRTCTWDAAISRPGNMVEPIDLARIAGPGLLKLQRHEETASIAPEDRSRWSREIGAIGEDTFRKLRELSVTLIGTGRTGNLLAMQLASLGCGHIRLVDPDLVEPHNLDCAPLLRPRDVGKSKAKALARRLLAHRPDLRVSCLPHSLTSPEAVAALRALPSDLLMTCVDSDTPRLAASLLARELLLPHLDLGTHIPPGSREMHGDIRMLLPGQGCTRCIAGYVNEEQTLYELAAPPGSLKRGDQTQWHQARAGSLVSLNSLAVSSAVQMLLDFLGGRLQTSFWQRLSWQVGSGLLCEGAAVGAANACSVCTRA